MKADPKEIEKVDRKAIWKADLKGFLMVDPKEI